MRNIVFALLLGLVGPRLFAESPAAARLRELNSNVLRLHAEGNSRAVAVLAARAEAFREMIEQDPEQALSFAFPAELLARLRRSFPAAVASVEEVGEWTGELERTVVDDLSLQESRSVWLLKQQDSDLQISLVGDVPDEAISGSTISISGARLGNRVAAKITNVRAASLSCSTTGLQNAAVLLVTFPGVTPSLTPASVNTLMFGTSGRSLDGYWRDSSYGKTSTRGNVFGWYTLPTAYTCDQYPNIRTAAIAAADNDVYFPNYTRVFVIFPKPAGCTYGGVGTIGCTAINSPADGSFTASTGWLIADYLSPNDQGVQLAAHEGGHNLGLSHSRSRDFGTDALGSPGTTGTLTEYGDNFSPMGYYNLGHYSAQQKVQIGWMSSANVQTVQSSGTYSVAPLEWSTSGVQALKIQRGTGSSNWLWLEYRQPIGNYESTLSSQIFSGATVRYADSTTGTYTDLLDYTPATTSWYDPALAVGAAWTDAYTNVSLAAQSANSSGLTVNVSYGALTCTPANPTVSASPSSASAPAGTSASYTINLTNRDNSACPSTTFTLGTTQPVGWSATLSTPSLTLSPGQTLSFNMTDTPPAGVAVGTYAVSASAAALGRSATVNANFSVTAPISVSLSVPSSTYAPRSSVPMTATVLSGTTPASGATVAFTLKKPNGQTTTTSSTTSTNGQATWTYKLLPKDPTGAYTVSATATYSGQSVTSNSASFLVQ